MPKLAGEDIKKQFGDSAIYLRWWGRFYWNWWEQRRSEETQKFKESVLMFPTNFLDQKPKVLPCHDECEVFWWQTNHGWRSLPGIAVFGF